MRAFLLATVVLVAGCDATPSEICGNGIDDNQDDLTDCEDPLCRCATEEICTGGLDEDDDGLIDCADPDCDDDPACVEADCADGVDNDGDGLIDCEDPDCDGSCPEACEDGRDNDGNGLIDCEDPACVDAEACGELNCTDGLDDDGDGLIDCEDDDCWGLDCHPSGVRTEIVDGSMVIADVRHVVSTATFGTYTSFIDGTTVSFDCGPGDASVSRVYSTVATLTDVKGVARVNIPTDSGSVTEACDFTFTGLTAQGEDGALTPGSRAGFVVQDAARCRLAGTSWLPRTLTRDGQQLNAGAVRRYAIAAPATRYQTASDVQTTTFRESCYRSIATYTRSDSVYGAGVTGDEVTVLP